MLKRATIHVSGIVQGVGFRPFVYRLATSHSLKGYVLNLGDAGVEIVVEGDYEKIIDFIRDLRLKKPPTARIDSIQVSWEDFKGEFDSFKIAISSFKRSGLVSTVPPDVGICDECVKDILTPGRRWFNYPFTCCSICGPRFTIIYDLPYDRERTSMKSFPLCPACKSEYENPLDRRYHAEGICCPNCGPKMFLYDRKGELLNVEDPIKEAAELIGDGYIVAVKGIGGFHIAAKAIDDDVVLELRRRRRRPQQPFAVMSPDILTIKSFAIVGEVEEKLLTSYQRPIVLLRKSSNYYLSEYVSPGLHTIGVMLPYTGIHLLLLKYSREPALIMTSGNYPGEPMVISNEDAFDRLSSIVDYFLVHNREIINRCDDSVMRVSSNYPIFIRRSRGFAPSPIKLDNLEGFRDNVIALGAELQVTGAILYRNHCFLTQHIGDTVDLKTLDFLEYAISFLMRVLRMKNPSIIACDLHPNFNTTKLAFLMAEKFNAEVVQVQHHFAHLASLIAEHNLPINEAVVGIVIDGYGYGLDGNAWGGEIVLYKDKSFERMGQIDYQFMPGGDLATYYPARMLAGMMFKLFSLDEVRSFLISHCIKGFRYGVSEIDVVLKQLSSGFNVHLTSSLGRVLDAFSALFGVCYKRTYEGEPAMKFESFAISNSTLDKYSKEIDLTVPIIFDRKGFAVIDVGKLLRKTFDYMSSSINPRALAYLIHRALGRALGEAAVRIAKDVNAKYIGVSGGAAVNELLLSTIAKIVSKNNLKLLVHRLVPPGDGGLSLGQVFYASILGK